MSNVSFTRQVCILCDGGLFSKKEEGIIGFCKCKQTLHISFPYQKVQIKNIHSFIHSLIHAFINFLSSPLLFSFLFFSSLFYFHIMGWHALISKAGLHQGPPTINNTSTSISGSTFQKSLPHSPSYSSSIFVIDSVLNFLSFSNLHCVQFSASLLNTLSSNTPTFLRPTLFIQKRVCTFLFFFNIHTQFIIFLLLTYLLSSSLCHCILNI